MIYHITTIDDWDKQAASEHYTTESMVSEGFIHCSTLSQLQPTISRYYQGQRDLLVLEINPAYVKDILKYELAPIGAYFPHLYGFLPKMAILRLIPLSQLRDLYMAAQRPILPLQPAEKTVEKFQNDTLRPILKMQHSLLIQLFEFHIDDHQKTINPKSIEGVNFLIHDFAFTNSVFVNTIIGSIIGQFTLDELRLYHSEMSELRRRIITMSKERIKSHYLGS